MLGLVGSLMEATTGARAATPPSGKAAGAGSSAGAGKKGSEPPPPEGNQSERRAVRGVAVDDANESPELRELKRFEEDAFPRARGVEAEEPGSWDVPAEPPPGLPGRWEGSGDVPEVLRSPESARARAAPPAPDSEWLRSLKLPELPVRWDPQVLRYVDYFKNDPRGHAIMANWLRRAGRYQALIEATLAREGLPKDLLYVAMVESGFETSARSRVGAGGIWQFMPGAARAYGLEVGYWIDARRDPERSAEAAARYLKDLYVRFNSWPLVFAAYNAGYGAVLKSITRYNTNDYWELCHHEAGLPWESSLYVPKILAAAIVGHNVEAFGFGGIVPDPPFAFEKVEVPAGTTLGTVARASKARPEVIDALNPQIARDRTPPDRGNFMVRIPVGTAATFAEAFERTRTHGDRLDTVTLRFGETLDDVAKARGTSARELRRLNGVKDTGELRAGVAIVVPRKKGEVKADVAKAVAATPGRDGKDEGGDDAAEEEDILVAVPDRVFNYEGRERVFYRTRDGDTLDAIAEVFGVRGDDLILWNNLDAEAKLHPKMVLQVFVRKDFDPTEVVLLDVARVKVVTLGSEEFLQLEAARRGKRRLIVETKSGDTLVKLGRRYGLTVGDLARINRFSYNTELHEGQKVVVYSPVGEPTHDVAQGMALSPRRERGARDTARAAGAGVTKVVAKAEAKADGKSEGKIDTKVAGKNEVHAEARSSTKVGARTNEPAAAKRGGPDKGERTGTRTEVRTDKGTVAGKSVSKKK